MNKTDSYKTQMTKSYVEDELMDRIVKYANDNDMKQSPAVRKLIILGLRYEAMSKRSEAETQAEIVAYERRHININGVDEARVGALSELGAMERERTRRAISERHDRMNAMAMEVAV